MHTCENKLHLKFLILIFQLNLNNFNKSIFKLINKVNFVDEIARLKKANQKFFLQFLKFTFKSLEDNLVTNFL